MRRNQSGACVGVSHFIWFTYSLLYMAARRRCLPGRVLLAQTIFLNVALEMSIKRLALYTWGANAAGQLGVGGNKKPKKKTFRLAASLSRLLSFFCSILLCAVQCRRALVPTLLPTTFPIDAIACAGERTWIASSDAHHKPILYFCGDTTSTELCKSSVVLPDHATRIVQLAAGLHHTLALDSNGTVFAWGRGLTVSDDKVVALVRWSCFFLSTNVFQQQETPAVRHIACGATHSLLTTADGQLMSFGSGTFNESGRQQRRFKKLKNPQAGHGDYFALSRPRVVEALRGESVLQTAGGLTHSLIVTASGELLACGRNVRRVCVPCLCGWL